MKNLLKLLKVYALLAILVGILISIPFVLYLKVLPAIASSQKIVNYAEKAVGKILKADIDIKNPKLETDLNYNIGFKVDSFKISKDKKDYFVLTKFNSSISYGEILKKTIILNRLGADFIYVDVNKLLTLIPGQQKEKKEPQKFDWTIDWFNALFYVKQCIVLYDLDKTTSVKIDARKLVVSDYKEPKIVHFNIAAIVKKDKQEMKFFISDRNSVFIKDKQISMEKGILFVNNSKMYLNAHAKKGDFDFKVYANDFDLKNVIALLRSNLVVPNGEEMLAFFKDIDGSFDFIIELTKKEGLKGIIKLNNARLKVIPVNNLPITAQHGVVTFNNKTVFLKDFKGYYGKNKKNAIEMFGTIDDYMKSVDTNIEVTGVATNEFTKDYLSKLAGCKLTLTGGDSKTKLYVKSKYNVIDITWLFKLAKGKDILIEGASLSPVNWDRALKADFRFENNIFQIKTINYYIAKELNKNSKGVEPILTINGNVDCSKTVPVVTDLGFDIPKPLPSEFLNVLIGQKLFKKGTISGNMHYIVNNNVPQLDGNIKMNGVRIPSQRLGINSASFSTDKNLIYITADGRFKRSKYNFTGKFKNSLLLPVVIKDINLTVDNIDIEKIIMSMNQQNTAEVSPVSQKDTQNSLVTAQAAQVSDNAVEDESTYDSYTFDTGLIIVERCILHLVEGKYKDIKMGNLWANLTLDKNGVLQIKSNKFDFAEGISSLKVVCDLKKHDYYLRLGVKDINSDLIATTLLALKREITGKAMGLIEINTDDSLKLNGRIQFEVNNGTIAKVGLVEYALKFAALFRNPMAMISPSTIFDLVNVPEGDFDKIKGDIIMKDNVIEKMMIKSSAAQLSSFIIGRYDLVTRDASLRIYTKFSNKNKGFAGFLRNFSLNSLANRVSLGGNNDSLYYSAELEQLPPIDADEKDCQVFLTKVDGDVERFNFLSSLKKIK